jgi:hypothetical protein
MTDHMLTEATCTGLTIHLARPGAEAAEAEAVDILGPVRITVTDAAELPDITSDPGELARPTPVTLTLTVTAQAIHFATMLQPLDARLLALAAGMPDEQREEIGADLARLREAWRGGDFYADAAEALQVIGYAVTSLRHALGAEDEP